MKPKPFFVFFLICLCNYKAQAQQPNKTDLKKLLSGMPLYANQFLQFQDDTIVCIKNIISEKKQINYDELLKSSRNDYDNIMGIAGVKNMRGKYVCVDYIGQQTDKINLSFWYKNGAMLPNTSYPQSRDTLSSPSDKILKRLDSLPRTKFVRHEMQDGNWVIRFSKITNSNNTDSLGKACEFDASIYVLRYLDKDYRLYKRIIVSYINQNGQANDIYYAMEMDSLLLTSMLKSVWADPKSAKARFE